MPQIQPSVRTVQQAIDAGAVSLVQHLYAGAYRATGQAPPWQKTDRLLRSVYPRLSAQQISDLRGFTQSALRSARAANAAGPGATAWGTSAPVPPRGGGRVSVVAIVPIVTRGGPGGGTNVASKVPVSIYVDRGTTKEELIALILASLPAAPAAVPQGRRYDRFRFGAAAYYGVPIIVSVEGA